MIKKIIIITMMVLLLANIAFAWDYTTDCKDKITDEINDDFCDCMEGQQGLGKDIPTAEILCLESNEMECYGDIDYAAGCTPGYTCNEQLECELGWDYTTGCFDKISDTTIATTFCDAMQTKILSQSYEDVPTIEEEVFAETGYECYGDLVYTTGCAIGEICNSELICKAINEECTTDDECNSAENCIEGVCKIEEIILAACEDEIDNDGDGLIDLNDPSCFSKSDEDESETITYAELIELYGLGLTECTDGIDNDGDGLIDYPAETECVSPIDNDEDWNAECMDGVNNDDDATIDLDDFGCFDPNDNSETDIMNAKLKFETAEFEEPGFFSKVLDTITFWN